MTNDQPASRDQRMTPMTCEACGTPMNRHAEKVVVPVGDELNDNVDWTLGGFIEAIHQCPHCGSVQSRRV